MNEHDIIKLGRVKFEVIKIHINKINENNKNNINNKRNKNYNYNISNLNSNSKPIFNIDIQIDQYRVIDNKKLASDKKKENANNTNSEEKESEYHETINFNSKKLILKELQ